MSERFSVFAVCVCYSRESVTVGYVVWFFVVILVVPCVMCLSPVGFFFYAAPYSSSSCMLFVYFSSFTSYLYWSTPKTFHSTNCLVVHSPCTIFSIRFFPRTVHGCCCARCVLWIFFCQFFSFVVAAFFFVYRLLCTCGLSLSPSYGSVNTITQWMAENFLVSGYLVGSSIIERCVCVQRCRCCCWCCCCYCHSFGLVSCASNSPLDVHVFEFMSVLRVSVLLPFFSVLFWFGDVRILCSSRLRRVSGEWMKLPTALTFLVISFSSHIGICKRFVFASFKRSKS